MVCNLIKFYGMCMIFTHESFRNATGIPEYEFATTVKSGNYNAIYV